MKRNWGALFVAFVLGGAVFADNYTKGIDIHLGFPIGTTKMKIEDNVGDVSLELAQNIFEASGQIKVATYDCFLLNNMLGIYAAVGVNMGFSSTWREATATIGGESYTVSGSDIEKETGGELKDLEAHGFMTSLEFMLGPAFGVNLGGVRFQTGLAFHAIFGWGIDRGGNATSDYGLKRRNERNRIKYNAFGLALTPQFRFGASNKCSFVLGCDLAFDFPKKLTYEWRGKNGNTKHEEEMEFDKGFRFGATPYIGLGINF